MTTQSVEQLDPNFANPREEKGLKYYDVSSFRIEGKGWQDTERFFDRLPAKARGFVPEPVWELSHYSAGMCIRFTTNSAVIEAEWALYSERLAMPHMPATGVSGLDLYVKMPDGKWRWAGAARPSQDGKFQESVVLNKGKDAKQEQQEYALFSLI